MSKITSSLVMCICVLVVAIIIVLATPVYLALRVHPLWWAVAVVVWSLVAFIFGVIIQVKKSSA